MIEDKRRFDDEGAIRVAPEEEVEYEILPRHKWVLIREIKQGEKVTIGGVVLPGEDFFMNTKSPKHTYAKVVKVSPQVTDIHPDDMVVITKFTMTIEALEVFTGDPELKLVRDEEVYACIRVKPK